MWQLIAEKLHCTVREAKERIDAQEYQEYVVQYDEFPWGEDVKEWRLATLKSVIINAHGGDIEPNKCLIVYGETDVNEVNEKVKRFFMVD